MNQGLPEQSGTRDHAFTLHQLTDPQHGGVVVSAFEYPLGWQAQSNVVWNFQNTSLPVIAYARAFDPAGTEHFEFFPVEYFFWIAEGSFFYQQGQNVGGQFFLPPMSAADAMMRWVVPRYRGSRPDLKILGAVPVPQLAQRVGLGALAASSEDVCVKLEHSENGKLLEEEIYGVKFAQNVPYYGPQGMMTQVNWGFARLFSFRAEMGALDACRETFWRIASSVRMNPLWERLYAQILQQIRVQFDQYLQAGYSQIQAAAQLSQSISANNDALLQSFAQQRQAAAQSSSARNGGSVSSSSDQFDEYIRGVETFNDPYHGESQQDSNFRYHWTDGSGNYVHSDDPLFNPNIGSPLHWTIMTKKGSDAPGSDLQEPQICCGKEHNPGGRPWTHPARIPTSIS